MRDRVPSARRAVALTRTAFFWGAYLAVLWLATVPKGMVPPQWSQLVWGLISTPAILGVTVFFARREARSLRDLGLVVELGSAVRFLAGIGIGVANYGLMIVAISVLVAPIHFAPAALPTAGSLIVTVMTIVVLACMEELGFRGYPLRTLILALGAWRAQALIAVAFGLCHVLFGWGWQQVVFGVLPSALLFGAVAQASGGLAMPTGVHAALNLVRVATGETATPGLWTIEIDQHAASHVATWAPVNGLLVTLLTTAGVWGVHWRRSRR